MCEHCLQYDELQARKERVAFPDSAPTRLAQLRESGPTGELVADRIELRRLRLAIYDASSSPWVNDSDHGWWMEDKLDEWATEVLGEDYDPSKDRPPEVPPAPPSLPHEVTCSFCRRGDPCSEDN